jgi:outer membrane lipoprotein-sorting protein
MKRILLIVAILLGVYTQAQKTAEARKLLDEVYAKVKTYKNITLDFDYVLDNEKENIHQETRGKVSMEGEKYHLNLSGVERIFDGNYVYTIDHEDEEVVVSKAESGEDAEFTPSKILTFYKKGYKFQWGDLKTIEGKKIQFIKLIPIHGDDDNKYILLGIDAKNLFINRVIYTAKNGTRTTFRIRSYKTDTTLPDKEFSFDEATYKAKDYIITRM